MRKENIKYFYIVITIEENQKYYSYVIRVNNIENLLYKLKIKGIVNATIAPTKQQAENLCFLWNDIAKRNGNYLFDETF